MISIRKKNRPAVGLVVTGKGMAVQHRHSAAIRIPPPQKASRIRSINNPSPAAPTSPASRLNVGQRLRRAAGYRDFHQLAIGEECQVRPVRRPEWIRFALDPPQHRLARLSEVLKINFLQLR